MVRHVNAPGYHGPERRSFKRRTIRWFEDISPADWVKFIVILIGIGIAWARMEARVASAEDHLSAIVNTLNESKQADRDWRMELLKLRSEDKLEIINEIQQLKAEDENLQLQISRGKGK